MTIYVRTNRAVGRRYVSKMKSPASKGAWPKSDEYVLDVYVVVSCDF
jgi:hypothetical protein